MKKIILLFMMLAGLTMNAQKCKYAKNEVDKFTNKTILETKTDAFGISGIGMGFSSSYSLYKSDDNKYIKFMFTTTGSVFAISKGEGVMLKLQNGDVVTLDFLESVVSDISHNTAMKSSVKKITTLVPITDQNIEKFNNSLVTDIRVYTTDGYVDDEVKEKRAKIFQELLKCI